MQKGQNILFTTGRKFSVFSPKWKVRVSQKNLTPRWNFTPRWISPRLRVTCLLELEYNWSLRTIVIFENYLKQSKRKYCEVLLALIQLYETLSKKLKEKLKCILSSISQLKENGWCFQIFLSLFYSEIVLNYLFHIS